MTTTYENMYVRLGLGNGDGTARYAHVALDPGVGSRPVASNLRGWRIRHEAADGSESPIAERVHRSIVTDENGYEYLWEQHDHRTDGAGLPVAIGRLLPLLAPSPGRAVPGDIVYVSPDEHGRGVPALILETECGPLGRGIRVTTGTREETFRRDLVSAPVTDPDRYYEDQAEIARYLGLRYLTEGSLPAITPARIPAHILGLHRAAGASLTPQGSS